VEWLRFWLDKGADPNLRLDRARITSDYRVPAGSSALDIARSRQHQDCQEVLEGSGARPGERAHWTVVVMSCDSNEGALYGAIPDGARIVESQRSRAKYLFDDDPIESGVAIADHLRRDEADAVVETLKAVGAVCELI
jgi:hypothetical protein